MLVSLHCAGAFTGCGAIPTGKRRIRGRIGRGRGGQGRPLNPAIRLDLRQTSCIWRAILQWGGLSL